MADEIRQVFNKPQKPHLRNKAEELLKKSRADVSQMPPEDVEDVIHELQVHQLELKLQNEHLLETQKNLSDMKDMYRDLYENAPVGYITSDIKGYIETVNFPAIEMFSAENKNLKGISFYKFVVKSDRDKAYLAIQQACENIAGSTAELKLLRQDNSVFTGHVCCNVFKKPGDAELYLRLTIIDISDRKQAEEALAANEQRLRLVVQSSRTGTWDWDLVSNRTVLNSILCQMLGLGSEQKELDAECFFEHIHPEDRETVQGKVSRIIESGIDFEDEFRVVRQDGQKRWFWSKGEVIRDSKGKAVRMAGINLDITGDKEKEMQKQRLINRIEQKNQEFMHLSNLIRHDFGNSALSINAFNQDIKDKFDELSEKIQRQKFDPEVKKELLGILNDDISSSISYISMSVKQIYSLLKGLRQLAKTDRVPINIAMVDMNNIARETVGLMQPQISNAGAVVTVDELVPSFADAVHLSHVFSNLLNNAIKYNDPERKLRIHIGCKKDDYDSLYYVQDNGIGISEKDVSKIFNAFFRIGQAKEVSGEGLGLALIAKILDRLDGRVWVESQPGKGSCFWVALPSEK